MPIANQIKSLAEDIEASYGARVATVSEIVKETQQTLGSFHRAHQKMADDLRDSLSTSERERMKDFAILIRDVKAAVEAIEKDTAETLADFRTSHREMSEAQRTELVKITKERIGEVSKKLSEFGRSHQGMARQLREELSSFQKKLERIVREMRVPVIADLKEAKRNWQNLARVMAAKRAGKPIPKPRAEMGVPVAVKEEAEKAFATGELKVKALEILQAHPGGMTLPQVGKALNVAYIRVAKPLKELIMEMRVSKRDSEYFPS